MASSMTFAVTVSRHYFDPQLWAIKLMSVIRDKTGVLLWHTKKTLCTHPELSKMKHMAIEYGLDNNIPFINGRIQGYNLWEEHQSIIEQHFGSKLSDLI